MPGKIGKVKIIKKPPALKPVAESGGMEEYIPNVSKSFKYIQVYLESSRHGQLAELTCVLMPSYACHAESLSEAKKRTRSELRAMRIQKYCAKMCPKDGILGLILTAILQYFLLAGCGGITRCVAPS